MFEALSTKLQQVFGSLRGQARLTEESVEAALREIRLALLEADVNFRVVKAFIDRVRDQAVDQEVLRSLTPDQQVVRIVRDEMRALFGDTEGGLPETQTLPRVIALLGLGAVLGHHDGMDGKQDLAQSLALRVLDQKLRVLFLVLGLHDDLSRQTADLLDLRVD